jgi:miniconductance mechanosensitive channel
MIEYITSLFNITAPIPSYAVRLLVLFAAAVLAHEVAVRAVIPILHSAGGKAKTPHGEIIARRRVIKRVFHLIPAAVVSAGLPMILDASAELYSAITRVVNLYCVIIGFVIYDAVLNVALDIYNLREKAKSVSITGIVQALKVAGAFLVVIVAVALLAGKSPVYFLSGLGAFTAILLLIFKDAILGLVAGIQLSTMDLVRKGDWIEIPKHGADGMVEDISLTTVKVRNWDRTLVAVPAYDLIVSSFKNWRTMFEGGGRRIKRSMRFDINSVRFLALEDFERLRKIKLIKPYLEEKHAEIEEYNKGCFSGADLAVPVNGRRLTNVGTYRAYCDAYLRQHPGVHKELMIMVRLLEPTEFGLPLEIYAFTNDVRWPFYEKIQADIFDHLIAILPEFGLKAYQR